MATLAAGIAHEINNPLTAVVANIELMLEEVESGHSDPVSFQDVLGEMRVAAARIRDIVKSMKLLARGDTATRAVVDVNETLERSLALAENTIRYKAHLVHEFGQGLYVEGDAAQLAQVFVSLLVNAAQALDDEEIVATTLQRALAKDYDVVVVTHGRDAVAVLTEDDRAPFDLIFCDLMMPEMSGEDVYAEVTKRKSELARRFVFITGGAFTTRGHQFLESVEAPVIDKPFDVTSVRAIVRSLTGR